MVYYDDDFVSRPQVSSLMDVFRDMVEGRPAPGFPTQRPDPACPDTWAMACVRGDYERASFRRLNHWVPLFHRQKLGDAMFDLSLQDRKKKLVRRENVYLEQIDEEDEDFVSSIQDQLRSLHCQKEFVEMMAGMDFLASHAPGDGNCFLWSVLAFELSTVTSGKRATRDEMLELRKDACVMFT